MNVVKFIYNPYSGQSFITDFLDDIIRMHQHHGYIIIPYCITFTSADCDFFELECRDLHHILIAGGDGTVNYFVNAIEGIELKNNVYLRVNGHANDFINDIEIYDIAGRLVHSSNLNSTIYEVELPTGVYMLQVVVGDTLKTQKVIVK